ncbi:MAG: hypothetical protein Q7S43_02915 [bacterium]|nr:hypothetical protein [bacterium]MDO8496381.1 hypothetical protein [bacterium]
MEKILIKPDAKEIVLRGKPEDGHVDVFSYNYGGTASNNLGGLFIIGHVQPATEDTSYMVNLVASLAKREYYAQADAIPKESFSKTLKKINEVLQDFFHNKDTKINIGIFAVAGENILISHLGKFKIILGRDGKDIDILNNINLFNKEHIQEKEFSNIVSGKIMPKDKIFAFYPTRAITAREKGIKADLLKLGSQDFADKLSLIKKDNDGFMCAGIHITINKYTEPAIVVTPQPQELKSKEPEVVLANKTSPAKEKPATTKDSSKIDILEAQERITSTEPAYTAEVVSSSTKSETKSREDSKSAKQESPMIRPSEFSSAKKSNFLSIILKKYKPSGIYIIGQQPILTQKRLVLTASVIGIILVTVAIAKITFLPSLPVPWIQSQEDKIANALLKDVKTKLKTAQTYKDENNILEARKTLSESLLAIVVANSQDEDLLATKRDILALFDQIDKAVDGSPSLFREVSESLGDDFQVWSFTWSLAKGEIKIQKPDIAGMINWYPYQDNLYVLASDGLFKITDAAKGKTNSVSWLNSDVLLPPQSTLIAVDSKIYVLTQSGSLVTYYKGNKESEVSTSIPVDTNSALLTLPESLSLYLVNKEAGRIYVVNKSTGALEKTIKLNNDQPLVSASIADNGTIYLLTADKKVWNIVP